MSANSLSSARKVAFYADAAGDIDLVNAKYGAAREIRCSTAGFFTVVCHGEDPVTLPTLAGERHPIQATAILEEDTDATGFTVYW